MPIPYPVFLDLTGRRALIVGGGEIAASRVNGLLEAGARVRVVSPDVAAEIRRLAEGGVITHEPRAFRDADVGGCAIVIAATDDRGVNASVARAARAHGVLVNVVDTPDDCDFYTPAVVRRGSLQIAISTDGKSPVLARHLREALEHQFGPEWERFVELLGEIRARLRHRGDSVEARKAVVAKLIASDLLAALRAGDEERVEAIVSANRST